MTNNPLQQYFRQPKIYVELPSKGVFSEPGTVTSTKITILGMTGMDEIVMKTPDALLSGDCIETVIKSCCPQVTNVYGLANMDIDCLLIAIRIATIGNTLNVDSACPHCDSENSYEIDLNIFMEHFKTCEYLAKIKLDTFIISVKPLTFKEANDFNLENFNLQRKLYQIGQLTNEEEKDNYIKEVYELINKIQKNIVFASVDQIELQDQVVTDKSYIEEFLENCDREIFDAIKKQVDINNEAWRLPQTQVVCTNCNKSSKIGVELNQSNFFATA